LSYHFTPLYVNLISFYREQYMIFLTSKDKLMLKLFIAFPCFTHSSMLCVLHTNLLIKDTPN